MLLLIWCCKRKSLRQRRMLPHGSILLTDYSFTRGFTPAVVRRSAVTEQIGLLGQSQLLPGKHCPSTLAVYEHQAAMLWTWSPLLFNSSSCSSALSRLRTRFTCRVWQLDLRLLLWGQVSVGMTVSDFRLLPARVPFCPFPFPSQEQP